MITETRKISIRLDDESAKILEQAKSSGITVSHFVQTAIKRSGAPCAQFAPQVLVCLANLQNLLHDTDDPVKIEARKEVDAICRALKLSLSDTTPRKQSKD